MPILSAVTLSSDTCSPPTSTACWPLVSWTCSPATSRVTVLASALTNLASTPRTLALALVLALEGHGALVEAAVDVVAAAAGEQGEAEGG